MKLKLIAAAAVMALSGAANAAIDTGTDGSGDFFLTMWDGANSYNLDLNLEQSALTSGIAAPGAFSFSVSLAADSVFNTFISTATLGSLVWNLSATESLGTTRTLTQTYSTLPATGISNTNARPMLSGVQAFAGAVNNGILAQGNTNSATFAAGAPGYADNTTGVRFGNNNAGALNFLTTGSLANNSYAAGLGLVNILVASLGSNPAVYTPITDTVNAFVPVRAYIDANYNLHIAAVPEPEAYAMLLAGLGLMGAIARRRRQQG